MQDTFYNNAYNKDLSMRHLNRLKHNKNTDLQDQEMKWAILHIAERKQRKSWNFFKIWIRYTIRNIVKLHPQIDRYKIWCVPNEKYGCALKCIEQICLIFYTRYKEYIQAIRNNNFNSGYLNHKCRTCIW